MSKPGGSSGGGGQAKSNAETINVSVKSQDGSNVIFRIQRNVKLIELMHAYCKKKQFDFQTVRFIHEGHRVLGKYTANKVFRGSLVDHTFILMFEFTSDTGIEYEYFKKIEESEQHRSEQLVSALVKCLKLEDGAEICCMFHQMGAGFDFMPKTT